jgi:hypothetical protein
MLDSLALHIVTQWEYCEQLHSMLDRAAAHFAVPVRAWIDKHTPGRWTGRPQLTA